MTTSVPSPHAQTTKRYPSVILATCVLPWNPQYELMEDLFVQVVRTTREQLTPHLYLFGTAGEGYAVTDAQYKQILRLFHEHTGGEHAMIGLISLSLQVMIQRIAHAYELGFRAFRFPCRAGVR